MRGQIGLAMLAALTFGAPAPRGQAQPSAAKAKSAVAEPAQPFPSAQRAQKLRDQEEEQHAIEAYRFFFPTVSMEAAMAGARKVGARDNQSLVLLEVRPRHQILTANSDTPYATGVIDLRQSGPFVIEMPAGAFMGLVNDHDQGWVADLGMSGPDGGRGGRYLIVPTDFTGQPPPGYHVARARTNKVTLALRVLPTQGVQAAKDALRQVKIHPLERPNELMSFLDVSDDPMEALPLAWEDNIGFWQTLHAVLQDEPALSERRAMYGMLASLDIEKGKPFAPDARQKELLERAAKTALAQMRREAFASERDDRKVWQDRQWEWIGLIADNASFEAPSYLDLEARDRYFVQAIVTSPAMFRRKPGAGSLYFLSARDASGAYLDGSKSYKLSVPQPVPAKLFWSVTAYDAKTRSQVQTGQNKAALRSMHDKFVANPDGTIDLYFGPKAPSGKEQQWIQTVPGEPYFLYFRVYGPEPSAFDNTWKPSDLERL